MMAARVFARLDADSDGKVRLAEWLRVYVSDAAADSAERRASEALRASLLDDVFAAMDADGSGSHEQMLMT